MNTRTIVGTRMLDTGNIVIKSPPYGDSNDELDLAFIEYRRQVNLSKSYIHAGQAYVFMATCNEVK